MSERAASHVTEHDDGKFIRTAIVAEEKGTSFDIVDEKGMRLAVVNVFPFRNDAGKVDHVIIDVIDVDERFPAKLALIFNEGKREFHVTDGNLVCADFRTGEYVRS